MKNKIFLLWLLMLLPLAASAEWKPTKTNRMVNDYAGMLSTSEVEALEQRLEAFSDTTGQTQVVIITTNTLGGDEIKAVGQRIGQEWGIGGKKRNNGVLVLILSSEEEGNDAAILTGYGAEGVLPDITCKHLLDRELIPYFKEGRFGDAFNNLLDKMLPILSGEFSSEDYEEETDDSEIALVTFFVIVIVVIVLIKYSSKNGGGSGSSNRSRRGGGSTYWGGSSYGGDSSFGGGGSSFGGFGGGSFGGGGASSKW